MGRNNLATPQLTHPMFGYRSLGVQPGALHDLRIPRDLRAEIHPEFAASSLIVRGVRARWVTTALRYYSAFTPATRITLPHTSTSRARCLRKSSGEPGSGSAPVL